MRIFQPRELARMRATQDSAMMDLCVLMRFSETPDALNHPVPSWTSESEFTACGLDMTGGSETRGMNRVVVRWDAKLRLPLDTQIDLRDRVRIVERFGAPCEPLVYEIAGPAEQGVSGLVLSLKKLDPSE